MKLTNYFKFFVFSLLVILGSALTNAQVTAIKAGEVVDPETGTVTTSPDSWTFDQALLERPGNQDIQLKLFLDYGSNPPLYPQWQAYFRKYQPPTLIVWGKNDQIFPAEGAEPFKRDLKNIEFHLLDTGHFALEEDGNRIAELIQNFLIRQKIR